MALIIKAQRPEGCEWTDNTSRTGMRYCVLKARCMAYKEELSKQYTINAHPIDYIPSDCPIIGEIPDSHGDLIDRKALSDAIGKVITDRDRMIGTYDTIEQIIEDAETIVEATE